MAILIKVSIYQEDITIINIYALNNRPSKYVKQKLTKWKGEINTPMMIIGAINTSSQEWVKLPDRRKVREWNLNNIINPPDLTCALAKNRIHILLKCTWDILQDRSYVRPQISQ